MRFTNLLSAASVGALLMSLAAATQAATFTTTEYTVTYDDSTSFGSIVGNGGDGSNGVTEHLSFSWNAPFGGSTGHDPVVSAAGTTKSFTLPSFTLTAHSGYEFSNLSITLGGSVFGAASATASFSDGLSTTYTGPDSSFGTWTLTALKTTGGYSSITFHGGNLTLNGSAGAIFATTGPEVKFSVAAVPEPESFALALAGLGIAAVALRRRQRA